MKTRTIERVVYLGDHGFNHNPSNDQFNIYNFKYTKTTRYKHKAKIIIEVEEEPLTFDRIKKECVSMKTKFIDAGVSDLTFLGFANDGRLVTDNPLGEYLLMWEEDEIKDWSIKDE